MAGLKDTLARLEQQAVAAPGTPQRQPLVHGLRVDVLVDGDTTRLQISRANVFPSDQELRTVLRDWPYPVPAIALDTAVQKQHAGRCYLVTHWPTQRERQAELLSDEGSAI